MKKTKARGDVIKILSESSFPISAEEIQNKLVESSINLSTLYRTLATFTKNNIVKKEINEEGIFLYSLLENGHNHILKCDNCQSIIFMEKCPFEELSCNIEKETGFLLNHQNTIIRGLCENCKAKKAK